VAYDFSSSQQEQNEIDDTVVNVEGPTYTKDTMPFCNAPAAAAAAAAPAPAAPIPNTATVTALIPLSTAKVSIKDDSGVDLPLQKSLAKYSSKVPE
jgi:hypothetical protein